MMLLKLIELKKGVTVAQGFPLNDASVYGRAAASLSYRDSH